MGLDAAASGGGGGDSDEEADLIDEERWRRRRLQYARGAASHCRRHCRSVAPRFSIVGVSIGMKRGCQHFDSAGSCPLGSAAPPPRRRARCVFAAAAAAAVALLLAANLLLATALHGLASTAGQHPHSIVQPAAASPSTASSSATSPPPLHRPDTYDPRQLPKPRYRYASYAATDPAAAAEFVSAHLGPLSRVVALPPVAIPIAAR